MRIHEFHLAAAGKPYARFPFFFDGAAVGAPSCALSLRASGDMTCGSAEGEANRASFFAALGVEPPAAPAQAHTRIVLDASADAVDGREGDGLVASAGSRCLSVTVADCLPVFLLDAGSGAYAVLHSGWKGTGIVLEALGLMARRFGTRPAAVAAVLGPCVCGGCYGVDEERALSFEAAFGDGGSALEGLGAGDAYPLGPVVRRDGGRARIDLRAANARLLAAAGVRNIAACRDCTFSDERFGSFRREGPGRFTRMAAVAGRLPEEL